MALALNAYLPDACIVLAERPQISAYQLAVASFTAGALTSRTQSRANWLNFSRVTAERLP